MHKKLVKILSIDGGGVRGLIPLMILSEIEKRTGAGIAETFDFMTGTSTGGLITLFLNVPNDSGAPKYTVENVIKLYEELGPKAFTQSKFQKFLNFGGLLSEKYDSSANLNFGKRIFGDLKLSKAVTEIMIASYELESSKPFFFKRWLARKDHLFDFKFIDIGGATAVSAPTYFKPHIVENPEDPKIKHFGFIDGGVVANNPAMCAYVEAKAFFPDAEDFMLVSLGTGDYTAEFLLENVHTWGGAGWIKPIMQIFLNGQSEIVDHQLRVLHETSNDQLKHYHRLQLRLNESEVPFDDFSSQKIHLIELLGNDTVNKFSKEIDQICQTLMT